MRQKRVYKLDKKVNKHAKKETLWDYIEFDERTNEITMEIPLSKLMSPEENKKLREVLQKD